MKSERRIPSMTGGSVDALVPDGATEERSGPFFSVSSSAEPSRLRFAPHPALFP
ncbi:hypothetical protein [Methanovulcanius yangii]|uniref:hypothetical protein n=1 Tax=Methanovulcanius yangii TaxID=1789227 RepID=UPI0029C9F521|nr:hypothetical protein [Methanovulcanius yangii]